jgi:hypothetical protein
MHIKCAIRRATQKAHLTIGTPARPRLAGCEMKDYFSGEILMRALRLRFPEPGDAHGAFFIRKQPREKDRRKRRRSHQGHDDADLHGGRD